MKKITALVLAASLASTTAFAGGLDVVAVEPEPEVVIAGPTGTFNAGIVIPLLLLLLLAAAASQND